MHHSLGLEHLASIRFDDVGMCRYSLLRFVRRSINSLSFAFQSPCGPTVGATVGARHLLSPFFKDSVDKSIESLEAMRVLRLHRMFASGVAKDN